MTLKTYDRLVPFVVAVISAIVGLVFHDPEEFVLAVSVGLLVAIVVREWKWPRPPEQ